MIAPSDLSTLQSAAAVKAVASNALADQLEGAVARAINIAANTGETSVDWNGALTDEIKQTLESQGYTVKQLCDAYMRPVLNMYTIEWK